MNILYIDVLAAINFGMDFLSLYFVGSILHLPRKRFRLIVAAAFGACFAVLATLFLSQNPIYYLCFFLQY